jgi:hypothetical protein
MRQHLPIVLSSSALAVALLGATPLGQAAGRAVYVVPPFAARAGFARLAGTADNAKRLNGRVSSVSPRAGQIPVLGANGKLPASIGAVGPQGNPGPAGAKGDRGLKGDKGLQGDKGDSGPGIDYSKLYTKADQVIVPPNSAAIAHASCNPGDLPVASNENLGGSSNVELLTEGTTITPANIGSTTLVAGSYFMEVKNRNATGNIVLTVNLYCAPNKP